MITIRELDDESLKAAVKLKISCWPEELQRMPENAIIFSDEYAFWLDWKHTGHLHHDLRTLIGAFADEELVGACFASIAEVSDHREAVEINGLWVDGRYRGQHIACRLLEKAISAYIGLGKTAVIVYNVHHSPANAFFRRLGGTPIRQDRQMDGRLLVDILQFAIDDLLDRLQIEN